MIDTNAGATSAAAAAVYNDFNGLAQLRREAQGQSPETVRKVAQQFEALFLQMMLKNMRNTGIEDKLFGSDQEKFYRDMFDQQLSVDLSKQGALGLTDLLVRQLSRPAAQDTPAVASADSQMPAAVEGSTSSGNSTAAQAHDQPEATTAATSATPSAAAAVTPGETAAADETIRTPEDFVRVLGPHAEDVARELGVSPRVLLAQAALETGWGQNVMPRADGGSSHNLFGIKADARWSGDRVVSETLEYEGGIAVKRRETFRAYDSYADSLADYGNFLRSNPRYAAALENGADPAAYLQGLQQAGYATDPHYADKIGRIAYGAGSPLTLAERSPDAAGADDL
jgi:flagellar protein FlgJ